MKRDSRAAKQIKEEPPAVPTVELSYRVVREIRQHARSSMSAEICGVLIGSLGNSGTVVEARIPGEESRQGGSHVTFTQDTWSHIYQVKDKQFPDKRIVGWYHSHPGFGIFLSDHDTFIHQNFFSDPGQVAWVYDPHSDEEGCFAWNRGEIERVSRIALREEPGETAGIDSARQVEPVHEEVAQPAPEPVKPQSRVLRAVWLVLTHLVALVLGVVIGGVLTLNALLIPQGATTGPHRSQTPGVGQPR